MQDGCKVYMDSCMASNGVGLTQIQETMALQTLTTIDIFYFIMCKTHINIIPLK